MIPGSRLRSALACALLLLAGCGSDAPPPHAPQLETGHRIEAPAPRGALSRLDLSGLPPEADEAIERIQRGGPFPYRQDGTTFQNREARLPRQPSGYYREYTVPTPGERTRGARRIVTGGHPPEIYYYTSDHYRSFTRIPERP
jgi:guanyl-specific ribonuclease Sa